MFKIILSPFNEHDWERPSNLKTCDLKRFPYIKKGRELLTDLVKRRPTLMWIEPQRYNKFMFYSLDILQVLNFESSSSVLHEGKSVWFKLELRSKTMYEFQWFHTGYLIANPSRRYKVTSLETENNTSIHTLHIANVLQRDMGN